MVKQAIPRGLYAPAVTNIPANWSPQWFRQFITTHLQNADTRNAISGPGISITGGILEPATVSATQLIAQPFSIVGNPTDKPGPVEDITATANGQVLQLSGDELIFATLQLANNTGLGPSFTVADLTPGTFLQAVTPTSAQFVPITASSLGLSLPIFLDAGDGPDDQPLIPGPIGLTGPQGPQGPAGSSGSAGSGAIFLDNDPHGEEALLIPGPQGPQGLAGSAGSGAIFLDNDPHGEEPLLFPRPLTLTELLPSQTNNAGDFLTTNGSVTSWSSPGVGSASSKTLLTQSGGASQSYNVPANANWLRIVCIGGGGGGGGGATTTAATSAGGGGGGASGSVSIVDFLASDASGGSLTVAFSNTSGGAGGAGATSAGGSGTGGTVGSSVTVENNSGMILFASGGGGGGAGASGVAGGAGTAGSEGNYFAGTNGGGGGAGGSGQAGTSLSAALYGPSGGGGGAGGSNSNLTGGAGGGSSSDYVALTGGAAGAGGASGTGGTGTAYTSFARAGGGGGGSGSNGTNGLQGGNGGPGSGYGAGAGGGGGCRNTSAGAGAGSGGQGGSAVCLILAW